jgi:hypothetical protein
MYVGITRAQRNLTLCHAKARSRFGRGEDSLPSRFLFELKGEPPPRDWSKSVRATRRAKGGSAKASRTSRGRRKKSRAARPRP